MKVLYRFFLLTLAFFCLFGICAAQDDSKPVEQVPYDKSAPPPADNRTQAPRSDNVPAGESSSRQTQIDVKPPANDASSHPEADLGGGDTDEFTPYNPMKAMKDVEVGDFYYKQENYGAAISRYREALEFKPRDAEATFKLAQALEKTKDYVGARDNYEAYLKILPSGPYAKKAKEALEKLPEKGSASAKNASPPPSQRKTVRSPDNSAEPGQVPRVVPEAAHEWVAKFAGSLAI